MRALGSDSPSSENFSVIEARTRSIYESQAEVWDEQRGRGLFEEAWLKRFASHLPPGGSVLDLGCGAGEPIARWLVDQGFELTGADFSPSLLKLFRSRFPGNDWVEVDMRALELARTFDGIIAWDSFFHLPAKDQAPVIRRIARHLNSMGVAMLTIGPDAGEVLGRVGTQQIYHASLAIDDYRAIFQSCGMSVSEFVANDPDCAGHSVLIARKTS